MPEISNEVLVKISSAGTISIPKALRRHMDMQKGDYVKVVQEGEKIIIKKVLIS